jgi:hypothetical protein
MYVLTYFSPSLYVTKLLCKVTSHKKCWSRSNAETQCKRMYTRLHAKENFNQHFSSGEKKLCVCNKHFCMYINFTRRLCVAITLSKAWPMVGLILCWSGVFVTQSKKCVITSSFVRDDRRDKLKKPVRKMACSVRCSNRSFRPFLGYNLNSSISLTATYVGNKAGQAYPRNAYTQINPLNAFRISKRSFASTSHLPTPNFKRSIHELPDKVSVRTGPLGR